MGSFSQREYGIKPTQIVDQAPVWLRTSFCERVYKQVNIPSWITRRLVEKLSGWLQMAYSTNIAFQGPEVLLQRVEWFSFYDAIEFIADHLRSPKVSSNSGLMPLDVLGPQFRGLTNELFDDCNVGWTLASSGLLERKLDVPLDELLNEFSSYNILTDAAQLHISKARKMLDRSSSDFENSIKESIGALESIGRATFPSASTFGDVLKGLRKNQACRSEMISILQKAYDLSNSAPGVRHAGAIIANATRNEAEYIYLLSLASIKYLGIEGII